MFAATQASPLQSVFLFLALIIAGFVFIYFFKSSDRNYLNKLFFAAFCLRAIFVYIVYYYLVGVGGDGFVFIDDRTYDAAGQQIAHALNTGKDGYELQSWQQNPGYFYLNGFVYSLLGTDTFSMRVINAFLSSLTAVLVYEIARLLFDIKVAKIAGLLSAFLPSVVYLSVLQFKDTALVFVMVYTTYLLISRIDKRISIQMIIALLISLFVMWYLRKDYTLPYIGIVLLWLILRYTHLEKWLEKMKKSGFSAFAGLGLLILGSVVLVALVNTQAGQIFIDRYDRITGTNQEFVEKASSNQIGFSRHLRINTASDLYKLPASVAFTTILPLPVAGWVTSGEKAGLALYSIANLFFILLLPYVLLGYMQSKNISIVNSVMIRWFPVLVLVGISIVFMGVLRYKEQLMPFFIIWAAVALSERNKNKNKILMLYVMGALSVFSAFIVSRMFR